MFTIGIADQVDQYDMGFLRIHFTHLHLGKEVRKLSEMEKLCRKFAIENNAALLYHEWRDEWRISNYSYQDIVYDPRKKEVKGAMYHVTGYDRTRKDGDTGSLLRLKTKGSPVELIIPLMLQRDLAGFYFETRHSNGHTAQDLVLGDVHVIKPMPRFRNRRIFRPELVLLTNE